MIDAKWLDKPDGPGWWWRVDRDGTRAEVFPISIIQLGATNWTDRYLWLRIPDPPPPPKPLPRSREVTLTARVVPATGGYRADVYIGEQRIDFWTRAFNDAREDCKRWCREKYQVEPTEVVE